MQLKNTMTKLKNSVGTFESWLEQAEERISSKTENLKLFSENSKRKKNEKE